VLYTCLNNNSCPLLPVLSLCLCLALPRFFLPVASLVRRLPVWLHTTRRFPVDLFRFVHLGDIGLLHLYAKDFGTQTARLCTTLTPEKLKKYTRQNPYL